MSANTFFKCDRTSLRAVLLGTTCFMGLAFGSASAHAQDLPEYRETIFGTVNVNNVTTRQQDISASNRAGAIFDSFNVCTVCTVNINSEGADPVFVGIVESESFEPSRILGTINSNARTVLRDRNGFIFGRDSVMNVTGLVATTGDFDTDAIRDGANSFEISNFADATITARGTINVEEGGFAALVGPHVRNFGTINARLGRVALAAGEAVTVDFYGDNLITLAADPTTTEAVIQQRGTIDAEGGVIQLTANAASAVVNNLVNVTGITKASSATMSGGRIILSAGRVNVAAEVDASGAEGETGGRIDITSRADTFIRDEAHLVTSEGGSVNITAGDDIQLLGPDEIIVPERDARNAVDSFGGDVNFIATGQIVIEDGQNVDAGGGDIYFENGDGLLAARSTIRTEDDGNISYEQVKARRSDERNTIQAALDAVINTGEGETELYVDEGVWDEIVTASGRTISNLVLLGAQFGEDARGAGEFTDGETVIAGGEFYSMDSVVVDGFYIGLPNPEEVEMEEPTIAPERSLSFIRGLAFYGVGYAEVVNNIIRGANSDSVYADDGGELYVAQNDIDAAGNIKGSYAGIHANSVDVVTVVDNDIANIENEAGVYIDYESFKKRAFDDGPSEHVTPTVTIAGNNFIDNTVAMWFREGHVDLTGAANTITGGDVGIRFQPFVPEIREEPLPDFDMAVVEPFIDGPFFGEPSVVSLVGDTIGSTVFDGQSTFFVQLMNGALFAPGEPTVLSGINATYATPFGTFTPSAGGLSDDQFAYLETMFQHFVDDNALGLFLFGLPETDGYDIEDTYRNAFANFQGRNAGPGFTITRLPNTGFGTFTTRGFGNSIGDLNNINPAAGGDASDLNDIDPAAGGNDASCWQDAVESASQGTPATYNMSAEPDDALNAVAGCNS